MLEDQSIDDPSLAAMVGLSRPLRQLVGTISRVAKVPRPVLIVGERGTGKELVARAVHALSRRTGPLIAINCAAFTDALLESELFGHEAGAFTGATKPRAGRFEQADRGTLFLDEVGNMSLAFQAKILRVVEYGTYQRVGGDGRDVKTSARVIAATNCDLPAKIADGGFLGDLYDRLSFEVIEVPPLRKRPADVEPLANHFLRQFAREIPDFAGKTMSSAALDMLRSYRFPGNVRELKNIIERAAFRDTTGEINPEDIGHLAGEHVAAAGGFKEKLDAFAHRLLRDALSAANGNGAEAARLLGLEYHQFRYFQRKHLGEGQRGGDRGG